MARSDYHARREARIARLYERAEKTRRESAAAEQQARRMADVIPLGQPILVGHHSERRDRRYRARIHDTFQRAFETGKEAAELERRAATAESNRAISSDNPDAADLIRAKLAKLEHTQAQYRAVNQAIRKGKRDPAAVRAALEAAGIRASEAEVTALLTPDFAGRIGIPDYRLTNNSANIRRLRQRLEALGRNERREATAEPERYAWGVTIEQADNRVMIRFPGKPPENVRKDLRAHGFVFSYQSDAWQRQASESALYWARHLVVKHAPAESGAQTETNEVAS